MPQWKSAVVVAAAPWGGLDVVDEQAMLSQHVLPLGDGERTSVDFDRLGQCAWADVGLDVVGQFVGCQREFVDRVCATVPQCSRAASVTMARLALSLCMLSIASPTTRSALASGNPVAAGIGDPDVAVSGDDDCTTAAAAGSRRLRHTNGDGAR